MRSSQLLTPLTKLKVGASSEYFFYKKSAAAPVLRYQFLKSTHATGNGLKKCRGTLAHGTAHLFKYCYELGG